MTDAQEMILRNYERKRNFPGDINEQMHILKEYAEKCDHITEFGTRSVVSTWALAAGFPKRLITVDLNVPAPSHYNRLLNCCNAAGIILNFFHGNTLKIEIEPTDLLFIDTYHTAKQLKAELKRHAHKVRKYILIHDTVYFGERGEDGGPGLLYGIRDFLKRQHVSGISWGHTIHTEQNGITVLERIAQ